MVYNQFNLRFLASRLLNQRLKRRFASGTETNRRSGFGKILFYTTSATTLGLLGTAGCAYVDPQFRKALENSIPGTAYVFSSLFGNSDEPSSDATPRHKAFIVDKNAASNIREKTSRDIPPPLFSSTPRHEEKISVDKSVEHRLKDREEIAKLVEEMLDKKLSLLTSAQKADLSGKVQLAKSEFEEELRKELARQSSTYASHEEQMLRSQRDNLTVQHKKEMQEALLKERQEYLQKLSEAIAQLTALDVFLNGRAEFDGQNRRAKKLWISCQNLKNLLCKKSENLSENFADPYTRRPLANVIAEIKNAGDSDDFVKLLLNTVPEQAINAGIYSEEDLAKRYDKVKISCKRFARIGNDRANIFQYLLSYLQSLFIWDNEKATFGTTQIDPKETSVYELLSRTSYCLKNKDYESAIRLMSLLEGEPARISSDWLTDLRSHVEVEQLASLLLAHASAQSIRSLY